jgi:uncharacterized membrane protein YkvA (DUF1232 family)
MNESRLDPEPVDPSPAGGAAGAGGPVIGRATVDPGAGGGSPSGQPMRSGDSEQLRNVLLFLPRFVALLGRMLLDPEVSGMDKLLVGAAVAYVVSPIDILPDIIPVVGQLDDIYLVALCLLRLLNRSGEAKIRSHWDGPEDIAVLLQNVSQVATRYLPDPVRTAVRRWVEAQPS